MSLIYSDPKLRIHPNLQNNYSGYSDKFVDWDRATTRLV